MAKFNPYRAPRRRWLNNHWLWIILLVIIIGIVAFYTQKVEHAPPTVTLSTSSTPAEVLNNANLSDDAIKSWAYDAVLAVYSYDHLNYEQQLGEANNYFLPKTWELFYQSLQRSNTLKTVVEEKLSISAKIDKNQIRILDKKVDAQTKRYTWKVQVPLQIIYLNNNVPSEQPTSVTLTIVRAPHDVGTAGVAISKFIVNPRTGEK